MFIYKAARRAKDATLSCFQPFAVHLFTYFSAIPLWSFLLDSTHKLYTITRWEDKVNAENWPNALTKLLSSLGRPSRGRWGSNGSPECRQIRIVNSCGFDTCHTNGLIRWEQWSRTKAYRHFKHRASLFINLLRRLPGERCKGIKCDLCAIIRVIHVNVATAAAKFIKSHFQCIHSIQYELSLTAVKEG